MSQEKRPLTLDAGDIPFDIIGFVSGILIVWVIETALKALKE